MNDQPTYAQRAAPPVSLPSAPKHLLVFGPLAPGDVVMAPDGWKIHSVSSDAHNWATAIIKKGRSRIEACVLVADGVYRVDTVEFVKRAWIEPRVPIFHKHFPVYAAMLLGIVLAALLSLLIDWWLTT